MGFFGSGDKVQSDVTNQLGASDSASLISAAGSNIAGEKLFQGSNVSDGILALTNSNVRDVSITDGGAFDLARDFADNYGKTVSELLQNQTKATNDSSAQTAGLINNLLSSFGALVESKNTDGQSSQNNTVLYIALAVAAVFGIFFWTRRTR